MQQTINDNMIYIAVAVGVVAVALYSKLTKKASV
jgi:hypothetical protein